MANPNQRSSAAHDRFPWKHLIGFGLSIVLTLMALWVALYTDLSVKTILIIIFLFAVLQALLQLLLFMHMTESSSGKLQTRTMLYAAFIAITVVAGSVWVMSSGHAEHDHNNKMHEIHTESSGQTEHHH